MVPPRAPTRAGFFAAAAALAVLSGPAVLAGRQAFESHIQLVAVTATVTDAAGRLVTGLTKEDFEVFDDGERQVMEQFTADRVSLRRSCGCVSASSPYPGWTRNHVRP